MKILYGLLFLLSLTACQSSLIADLVTQSGQAFYQDDFSDPGSGWTQISDVNGSLGYTEGGYQMLVQSAGYDLWAVSRHQYKDVRIEVDATRLEGPVVNRFGLICRYQDMDNFYVFIISSDGYYAIGKIENGEASLLGQEMMAYSSSILQGDSTNHIRFDCIGNTLTGTVNDQRIAIASDANFSGGDAGLLTGAFDDGGVTVSFDNFVVYKP